MIEKRKKVLIVHNYYQIPGGEDTVVANEKRLLERHGHEVILYSRNNSELNGMSLVQKLSLPFTTIFNIRTYKDIKRIIKDHKIDIVHVHNTLSLISPSVYYAALSYKVPIVQTVHNFRLLCPGATFYRDGHICEECIVSGLKCAIKYSCYRGSRLQTLACVISTKIHRMTGIYGKLHYICLTEFNKEKLLSLRQIHPGRVFVKPNFVEEIGEFIPEEKRADQFIFAGRLDMLKGIDILFKAWKRMGSGASKLIVCGVGPMENWCKEFVANNAVNIELKGLVSNIEARKLIANSKALILPTQWYEGFPMSIVEAFAVGTPVICSDLGNVGSSVVEGVTGCKFKANSIEELVKAVGRCSELCTNTLDEYKKKYTEGKNYEKLIEIYQIM